MHHKVDHAYSKVSTYSVRFCCVSLHCTFIPLLIITPSLSSHAPLSEAVPPEVYQKKPMCMSQYNMFQKCRIPRPEMDESQQTPIDQARHVLVVRNGHVSVCVCVCV